MALFCLTSCGGDKQNDSGNKPDKPEEKPFTLYDENDNYKGELTYWVNDAARKFKFGFHFDVTEFATLDNTKYNRELAKFGIISSGYTQGATVSFDDVTNVGFFKQLGFKDYKHIIENPDDYEFDKDDTTRFDICHQKFDNNELLFISISGTACDEEWMSDTDIGADTEEYYKITGEHPEWKNKKIQKNLDIAVNRALPFIDNYTDKYLDKTANKIALIVGHSRGGSVGNILGTIFEEREEYKSFTYTYASVGTTTDLDNCAKYKTIYNIVNADDAVPNVPSSGLGFARYGKDIGASVGKSYSKIWDKYFDFKYVNAEGSKFGKAFTKIAQTREGIYKIDRREVKTKNFTNVTLANEAYRDAIALENEYKGMMEVNPLRYEKGTYILDVYYSPVFVIRYAFDKYFVKGESFDIDDIDDIVPYSIYKSALLELYKSDLGEGIEDGHIFSSYYIIARFKVFTN